LLAVSPARSSWTTAPVDWEYLPTPRRAAKADRDRIQNRIDAARPLYKEFINANQIKVISEGMVSENCGTSAFQRFVWEYLSTSCRRDLTTWNDAKRDARIAEAKTTYAINQILQLEVKAYNLAPISSQGIMSTSPRWNPAFSFVWETDSSGRKRLAADQGADYGVFQQGRQILIFPRSFFKDVANLTDKAQVEPGADRLALSLLHETVHFAATTKAFDDHGFRPVRRAYEKREEEAAANEAEADLLELMNRDETINGQQAPFTPAQIEHFRKKARDYRTQAKLIRDRFPDAVYETQLPSVYRHREFAKGAHESSREEPFDAIEVLREAAEDAFMRAQTDETNRVLEEIQQSQERMRQRNAQETTRSNSTRRGYGSESARSGPTRGPMSGNGIYDIPFSDLEIIERAHSSAVSKQAASARPAPTPTAPATARAVPQGPTRHQELARLARIACRDPYSISEDEFDRVWRFVRGAVSKTDEWKTFGFSDACERETFNELLKGASARENYSRSVMASIARRFRTNGPPPPIYTPPSGGNNRTEPEPAQLPPCWPNCVHWN